MLTGIGRYILYFMISRPGPIFRRNYIFGHRIANCYYLISVVRISYKHTYVEWIHKVNMAYTHTHPESRARARGRTV